MEPYKVGIVGPDLLALADRWGSALLAGHVLKRKTLCQGMPVF